MQSDLLLWVTLALAAFCSDGLTIEGRAVGRSSLSVEGPTVKAHVVPQTDASDLHAVLAQQLVKDVQIGRPDPILMRPSAGKGVDKVQVGLIIMNFFGTNLAKHTFSIDMVMSCQWNDPRAIDLIPAGLDQLSLAWTQAVDMLWMPGIVVTNRDIEMYEIVSASVTIFRSGEVRRVERAQARILMKFKLAAYPFDTQHLGVKVASSKYMVNEVVLVPDRNVSGVKENIWGLYYLQNSSTNAYETSDAFLRKSRAILDIEVKRGIIKYYEDHLVPSFISLTISWAVFYFPFANPFITPRLALSILALLTFTNLMVKSSKELPGSAPFNWNDLFNQQMQALMFITIVLNICSELAHHQFHNERLAKAMNNQAKGIMPSISILNAVIILGSGQRGWMSLDQASFMTKLTIVLFAFCYFSYVGDSMHKHVKSQREIEIKSKKELEEAKSDDGDLAFGPALSM